MKRFAITLIVALLAACGQKDVSFDTLETARAQSRSNADFNAKKWRADTKLYADANLVIKGDSSQTPQCPQGDGWASIEILNATGQKITGLKCSTVSLSVGCRVDADFKSSPYANEDGSCQPTTKVPHPLPKLVQ